MYHVYGSSAFYLKHLHDLRLVWALEAPVYAPSGGDFFSWLIALGEYCFQVPANRIGYGRFTGYQLKIMQECITLVVFVVFAYLYLGEPVRWNYALSFACIVGAVFFAFSGSF
jgi:hypothetical protein